MNILLNQRSLGKLLKFQKGIYQNKLLTQTPLNRFCIVAPAKELFIGVPKEIVPGEKRVALTPDAASKIIKSGYKVRVEKGAGEDARITDAQYTSVGCEIVDTQTAYQ